MKNIEVKSKNLVKAVKDVKKISNEIKSVHEQLVELDKKHKKLQYKIQKHKDRGSQLLHKALLKDYEMGEFEYSSNTEIVNDKTISVEINDFFEDNFTDKKKLKDKIRKDKKNKEGIWKDPLMFTGHKD